MINLTDKKEEIGIVIPLKIKISELLLLKENWDSYGAPQIDPYCVATAYRMASQFPNNLPWPSVVATNEGGVAFEWHMHNIDLEIEFLMCQLSHESKPSVHIYVYFEDHQKGEEWEGDPTISDSFLLTNILSTLIDRST